jgi:transposase
MLYVGIDQHTRQLTVCIRDEAGDVFLRQQIGTHPEKMNAFFDKLVGEAAGHGGFAAVLEVCGFNDWLVRCLRSRGCQRIVVIQPDDRSRRKTDRRDAARLSELLWINRHRLLAGTKVNGLRVVELPDEVDAENRQLTSLRQRLGQQRTRVINKLKRIIHKHNLIHDQPTKLFQTKAVQKWLRKLALPEIDRLEMDLLLTQWELVNEQLQLINEKITARAEQDRSAQILLSICGCGCYTALAIASRIGRVERFRRGRALANFFGLTPTCSNSGESGDRLGHISKQGSTIVRFLLGQLITRVLQQDADLRRWYQAIKRRRGAQIARVAVMRRLTTAIWHMLTHEEPYLTSTLRKAESRPKFLKLPPRRPSAEVVVTS